MERSLASISSDTIAMLRRLERSLKASHAANSVQVKGSFMLNGFRAMLNALATLLENYQASQLFSVSQVSFMPRYSHAVLSLTQFAD